MDTQCYSAHMAPDRLGAMATAAAWSPRHRALVTPLETAVSVVAKSETA